MGSELLAFKSTRRYAGTLRTERLHETKSVKLMLCPVPLIVYSNGERTARLAELDSTLFQLAIVTMAC